MRDPGRRFLTDAGSSRAAAQICGRWQLAPAGPNRVGARPKLVRAEKRGFAPVFGLALCLVRCCFCSFYVLWVFLIFNFCIFTSCVVFVLVPVEKYQCFCVWRRRTSVRLLHRNRQLKKKRKKIFVNKSGSGNGKW